MTPAEFVRTHTRLARPPLVPELRLHLADDAIAVWESTERAAGYSDLPPPFWAFAWAGGQALARYLLDHPDVVRGRRVLDVAAGCGVVGIAAALAGAGEVVATEIDPYAVAAVRLNAAVNDVSVASVADDVLDGDGGAAEVVLVGDLFYERALAARSVAFCERAQARGAAVLLGDLGRAYLPRERLEPLLTYDVPVPRDLEDAEVKPTTVWRPRGPRP